MTAETPAVERLEASRVRDIAALIEENTLQFILGPHRKEYIAHDMPLKFWLRRLTTQGREVKDLELVCACLRVAEDELLEVAEVGMVEIAKTAQLLIDHFLAQAGNVEMIRKYLHNPELLSALYRTTPTPSAKSSESIPVTPSETSST